MSDPVKEAIKEVWRWLVAYVGSGIVSSVVGLLITALPFFPVNIFPERVVVSGFVIPIHSIIVGFIIPSLIRGLDKWKYSKNKEKGYRGGDQDSLGLPVFNMLNKI